MSARQRLVAALIQNRPGGRLATLADVEHAEQLVDAYRAAVLREGATELDRIANQVEAKVTARYGAASGIGPGVADMVREGVRTLRDMAKEKATVSAATATPQPLPAPRPCALPDERFTRARRVARIAGFFRAARTGRTDTAGAR